MWTSRAYNVFHLTTIVQVYDRHELLERRSRKKTFLIKYFGWFIFVYIRIWHGLMWVRGGDAMPFSAIYVSISSVHSSLHRAISYGVDWIWMNSFLFLWDLSLLETQPCMVIWSPPLYLCLLPLQKFTNELFVAENENYTDKTDICSTSMLWVSDLRSVRDENIKISHRGIFS